jgi:hypothetical protein
MSAPHRYAFWKDGALHLIGVQCSGCQHFNTIPDMHAAAARVRELVRMGIVTHGRLQDKHGQTWDEALHLQEEGK